MQLEDVPGRVFLDTCVVNFMLDHGEQIHDATPPGRSERAAADVEALRRIWITGQRASWQLAISPHTYNEVVATVDPSRRRQLESWFMEIWQFWREIVHQSDDLPSFIEADDLRIRVLASGALDHLPDFADRVLLCDALSYRCDLFCTRDWSTIIKHRSLLQPLGIDIVTPAEWWLRIQPFENLWE